MTHFFSTLIQPPTSAVSEEDRLQARLALVMLLITSIAGVVLWLSAIIAIPGSSDDTDTQLIFIAIVVVFGGYLAARAGQVNIGIITLIAATIIVSVPIPFLKGSQPGLLALAVIPVFLTAFFFRLREILGVSLLVNIMALSLVYLVPWIQKSTYFLVEISVIFTSVIVVAFIDHRERVEAARQKELLDINKQLRESEINLEKRVQERTRDLNVAAEVSTQISNILDANELLPILVDLTRQSFDLYHVSIFLFNKEIQTLRYAAGAGVNNIPAWEFGLGEGRGIISRAARTRTTVLVNDVGKSPDYLALGYLPDTQAELALPMVLGGELIGVLDLQASVANHFNDDNAVVMSQLAKQFAIAVENARLYADQVKIAEELRLLDQMKSQFLASMSHELRTPLNAILNFTQFVKLGMLGEVNQRQIEALGKSLDSGNHLLSLINDVLDITKIESGMMKLFVEEGVNLHPEIDSAIAATTVLLADKPVKFIQDIDYNLPLVVGDKRRIRQIFLNLLSNAAKFTDEGTITFSIKRQDNELMFMVSDTGPGIPSDKFDLIFEPFEQTETGIRHAGGTGLGLPITKRLIEAHLGRLWLESTLGEGTSFLFTLPIHSADLLALIELPEKENNHA